MNSAPESGSPPARSAIAGAGRFSSEPASEQGARRGGIEAGQFRVSPGEQAHEPEGRQMPEDHSTDAARSRDEDLKPGSPPRPATEPQGSEGSSDSRKTRTDPATGAPHAEAPDPA
jgi:hypothetical protein